MDVELVRAAFMHDADLLVVYNYLCSTVYVGPLQRYPFAWLLHIPVSLHLMKEIQFFLAH